MVFKLDVPAYPRRTIILLGSSFIFLLILFAASHHKPTVTRIIQVLPGYTPSEDHHLSHNVPPHDGLKCEWSKLPMPLKGAEVDSGIGPEVRFKIIVHHDDLIGDVIWNKNRLFESELQAAFQKALAAAGVWGNNGLYVDVGANVGIHALFFAKVGWEVHAFEPTPPTRAKLLCSVALNEFSNMRVYPYALGEKINDSGFCMRYDNTRNMGGASVSTDCDEKEMIKITTLDTMWKEKWGKRRVTMLKMDIEGHEPEALAGATQMFGTAPPVVVATEFNPPSLRGNKLDPLTYLRSLRSFGYALFDPLTLTSFPAEEDQAFVDKDHNGEMLMDLIAIHKGSLHE
ncbi:hypothetical protein HK104_008341 [Borealophlyctis nickersoniae]|nr:hypothetical protein HK104_008341 [Borealophlyctis nickersoniae]